VGRCAGVILGQAWVRGATSTAGARPWSIPLSPKRLRYTERAGQPPLNAPSSDCAGTTCASSPAPRGRVPAEALGEIPPAWIERATRRALLAADSSPSIDPAIADMTTDAESPSSGCARTPYANCRRLANVREALAESAAAWGECVRTASFGRRSSSLWPIQPHRDDRRHGVHRRQIRRAVRRQHAASRRAGRQVLAAVARPWSIQPSPKRLPTRSATREQNE